MSTASLGRYKGSNVIIEWNGMRANVNIRRVYVMSWTSFLAHDKTQIVAVINPPVES